MANVPEGELVETGAIPPDDFHDSIERVVDVAKWDLEIPADLISRLEQETSELLIEPSLLREAAAALTVGHLVLQGPPGTGKSSFAVALCRAFQVTQLPVTAREDWSTFEVIGRHELRVNANGHEEIVGVNGFFTEAVISCAGAIARHFDNANEPQGTWLLIDELNRAHPDKAFGELFTVLASDDLTPITLLHQPLGNNVLVTPRRFRIIATLNSIDKQFVNALSQGLKRRFTFLTLDIPKKRRDGEVWTSEEGDTSQAVKEYGVVLRSAAKRLSRRFETRTEIQLLELLKTAASTQLEALFNLAETVRYSAEGSGIPHVPIGTAQLIDTVELFLSHILLQQEDAVDKNVAIDWATSAKLAPLFDSDTVSPSELRQFAEGLPSPFSSKTRREILQIVSAGLYSVT